MLLCTRGWEFSLSKGRPRLLANNISKSPQRRFYLFPASCPAAACVLVSHSNRLHPHTQCMVYTCTHIHISLVYKDFQRILDPRFLILDPRASPAASPDAPSSSSVLTIPVLTQHSLFLFLHLIPLYSTLYPYFPPTRLSL